MALRSNSVEVKILDSGLEPSYMCLCSFTILGRPLIVLVFSEPDRCDPKAVRSRNSIRQLE